MDHHPEDMGPREEDTDPREAAFPREAEEATVLLRPI
jgi:hypothetical protein